MSVTVAPVHHGAIPLTVPDLGSPPLPAPDAAAANKALAVRVHAGAVPACAEAVLRRLLAPGFRNHDVLPGCSGGSDALVATMHWFDGAFSDQRVEVLHAVAEGDLVSLHLAFSARHTGLFRGLPPTFRRFTVREMHTIRCRDGLEAEHWVVRDEAWLERELRAAQG
ncbi:ester cyclase [Isoptericola sp. NEAU-Y5]|uniref:Ester cyclase n=1 Tax=Isoptericola luteus TaxID=2879484 RepID=A0ABS7ZJM0_9MICO|nr:ester cyclase [Isoptericola sp. NEAU-Y5]MCA5895216.1 ester cyclase [Isoptericola sp. NEAU-Y5]